MEVCAEGIEVVVLVSHMQLLMENQLLKVSSVESAPSWLGIPEPQWSMEFTSTSLALF